MCEKVKAVWSKIKGFVLFVGGAILSAIVVFRVAQIGKAGGNNWMPMKGQADRIQILNSKGKWEIVKLPKVEGRQITSEKIAAVGVSEGGRVNVKIKHVPVKRRG